MTEIDLKNLGVTRKHLRFISKGVDKLLSKSSAPDTNDEFTSLLVRLNEIYDHVTAVSESLDLMEKRESKFRKMK
jgi:hypothetical protein